jgi:hypothetical protein
LLHAQGAESDEDLKIFRNTLAKKFTTPNILVMPFTNLLEA